MSFLSIDYTDEFVKIYTTDDIRKEMFLKRPVRIVLDFNRFSGVKNFTKILRDQNLKKIVVGKHSGWYRIVLYMRSNVRYDSVVEQDGVKIVYK